MFGSKKKESKSVPIMHYEGLPNFQQDFPCNLTLEDDHLLFQDNNGNTVRLPYERIVKVDAMTEVNFMARYHNGKSKTKHGTVWFRVITYTSSAGEEKYVALWSLSVKVMKFFDQVLERIKKTPIDITL